MGKVKVLGLSAVVAGMIFMTGCDDGDTINNNTTVINVDSNDSNDTSGPSACMTIIGYPYANNSINNFITEGYGFMSLAFKGDVAYGVTTQDNPDWNNQLFSIDPTTGIGTRIANTNRAFDLAADPMDTNPERLYATDRNWCEFKEINTTSGDDTFIDERCYETIAFATDGTAYATDGNELHQLDINHTTGVIINDTFLADLPTNFHELAYNSADGKLYGAAWNYSGAVIRIDIGGVDDVNLTYVNKVECLNSDDSVSDGNCNLQGLDFKDGVMYGLLGNSSSYPGSGAFVKWNSYCGDWTTTDQIRR